MAQRRKERQIEVQERAPAPDLSYIPVELKEHFEAAGYRLSLASVHENNIAALSTQSRYPLTMSEIPEGLRDDLKRKSYGFRIMPDETIRKADCLLYVQPLEAYDAFMLEGTTAWMLQDSPDAVEGVAAEIWGSLPAEGRKISQVRVFEGGSLSEHVGR